MELQPVKPPPFTRLSLIRLRNVVAVSRIRSNQFSTGTGIE